MADRYRRVARIGALMRAFSNWLIACPIALIALPSSVPPRRGWDRLAGLRVAFKVRGGPTLTTRAGNAWPIIEVFAYGEYAAPLPWETLGTIVDAGAHVGAFTCWVAERSPRARITSFEPDPGNFSDLEKNIDTNGLKDRVQPIQAAVGMTSARQPFVGREHGYVSSLVSGGETGQTIEVKTVDLDRWLREKEEQVDLLKMDCEGAEWEILAKLSSRAWEKVRYLLVEYHTLGARTPTEMKDIMSNAGLGVQELGAPRSVSELPGEVGVLWGQRSP